MSVASETLAPVCVTASKSGAAAPLISSGMLCSSPAPSAVVKKREVFINWCYPFFHSLGLLIR